MKGVLNNPSMLVFVLSSRRYLQLTVRLQVEYPGRGFFIQLDPEICNLVYTLCCYEANCFICSFKIENCRSSLELAPMAVWAGLRGFSDLSLILSYTPKSPSVKTPTYQNTYVSKHLNFNLRQKHQGVLNFDVLFLGVLYTFLEIDQ